MRDDLLAATMEYVAENGVAELSLRQLAVVLGTSHRMLIYHFGSKEGLLVEVVRSFDKRNRELVAARAGADDATPAEQLRELWRYLSDPSLAPYQRLFVELYGQGLQGRPHMDGLPAQIRDSWLGPVSEMFLRTGMERSAARDQARLTVAVVFGLVMDRLAGGSRARVDAALDRYLEYLETTAPRVSAGQA